MRFLGFAVLAMAPAAASTASPSMIEMGGPEWGFAHGSRAVLASFNLTDLLASTVGQWMQTGRSLSLSAAELVLGEIDHVSVSIQNGAAVLLTGHFERQLLARLMQASGLPAPRMLDGNTMLIGEKIAVEAAVRRISSSWNARLNGSKNFRPASTADGIHGAGWRDEFRAIDLVANPLLPHIASNDGLDLGIGGAVAQ